MPHKPRTYRALTAKPDGMTTEFIIPATHFPDAFVYVSGTLDAGERIVKIEEVLAIRRDSLQEIDGEMHGVSFDTGELVNVQGRDFLTLGGMWI